MAVKAPITVEGNLGKDPELGTTAKGDPYARLLVVENDRRFNEEKREWEDGEPVFHNAVVYGQQAENVSRSLREGDRVLVSGDLHFQPYERDGQRRQGVQIVANAVAPSLRFATADVHRNPKAPAAATNGPAPEATGPVFVQETPSWPTVSVPS